MNRETPYREQAEKIRKKIDRNDPVQPSEELPPRQEIHGQKRHKNKWKLKYPIIRLLVLFFILMPISIYSAYSYLNGNNGGVGSSVKSSGGYERISLELEAQSEQEKTEGSPSISAEEEILNKGEQIIAVEPAALQTNDIPATDGKSTPVSRSAKEPGKSIEADKSSHSAPLEEIMASGEERKNTLETMEDKELIYHTVQKGENLFRISLKYYQSQQGMEIIRKANNLQGDEVLLGQVLKIPLKN